MSIVQTITDSYHFWNWLKNSGSYQNNFSMQGAYEVQSYYDEMSESLGDQDTPVEFDPVAWCVEFSEYDSALEAAQAYDYEEGVDLEPHGSVDLTEVAKLEEAQAIEWLEERTTVLKIDGGHVAVQEF